MLPSANGVVMLKWYTEGTNEQARTLAYREGIGSRNYTLNACKMGHSSSRDGATGFRAIENMVIRLPSIPPPVTRGDNVVGKQADTEWKIVDSKQGPKS